MTNTSARVTLIHLHGHDINVILATRRITPSLYHDIYVIIATEHLTLIMFQDVTLASEYVTLILCHVIYMLYLPLKV